MEHYRNQLLTNLTVELGGAEKYPNGDKGLHNQEVYQFDEPGLVNASGVWDAKNTRMKVKGKWKRCLLMPASQTKPLIHMAI
jgi:hypothetical protein